MFETHDTLLSNHIESTKVLELEHKGFVQITNFTLQWHSQDVIVMWAQQEHTFQMVFLVVMLSVQYAAFPVQFCFLLIILAGRFIIGCIGTECQSKLLNFRQKF